MTDTHIMDSIAELLEGRCGLTFKGVRRTILEGRIRQLAAERQDLDAYHAALTQEADGGPLWNALISAATTNESSWFRYPEHFAVLKDFLLPAIASNKEFSREPQIRILSAGCSIGQEPYSIAMTLEENAGLLEPYRVSVLACDLCETGLEQARAGLYREPEMRGLDAARRERFFMREGGGWRISPTLAGRVEFRRHNLLEPPPGGPFDCIFCRNVTIYFTAESARNVVDQLAGALHPGGHFFAGHAESYVEVSKNLKPIWFGKTLVYRRPHAVIDAMECSAGQTAGQPLITG